MQKADPLRVSLFSFRKNACKLRLADFLGEYTLVEKAGLLRDPCLSEVYMQKADPLRVSLFSFRKNACKLRLAHFLGKRKGHTYRLWPFVML